MWVSKRKGKLFYILRSKPSLLLPEHVDRCQEASKQKKKKINSAVLCLQSILNGDKRQEILYIYIYIYIKIDKNINS